MRKVNKAADCAKCGACTVVCPAWRAGRRESFSARGKLHLLEGLDPEQASAACAEILSQCLLCGACRSVCSRGLDPPARLMAARARLKKQGGRHGLLRGLGRKTLANPALLAAIAAIGLPLLDRLPADSGLRLRLGLPGRRSGAKTPPRPAKTTAAPAAIAYFPGCLAAHLHREIAGATAKIVTAAGKGPLLVPADQGCCGLVAASAGDPDTARRLARQNIAAFASTDLPILTSCASCYSRLRDYPQLFADDPHWQEQARAFADRLLEFSTFVAGAMAAGPSPRFTLPGPRTVVYHDPCHLRFQEKITAPPRAVLHAVSGLTLREPAGGPRCCGQGGLFHLAHPDLAQRIRDDLFAALQPAARDIVTTTCSGCLLHIGQGLALAATGAEIRHLAVLLAENLVEP